MKVIQTAVPGVHLGVVFPAVVPSLVLIEDHPIGAVHKLESLFLFIAPFSLLIVALRGGRRSLLLFHIVFLMGSLSWN